MPRRDDPTLWFNLPGVVAAYQPVMAPNSAICRWNQANGGDNRYRAVDGVAPAWASQTGWGFTGTEFLTASNLYFASGMSMLIGYSNFPLGVSFYGLSGARNETYRYGWYSVAPASWRCFWGNVGFLTVPAYTNAVMGMGSPFGVVASCYVNGIYMGTTPTAPTSIYTLFDIGRFYALQMMRGSITAVSVFSRPLSSGEFYAASRQMAYCDVNPDWSAWGVRRRWYIMGAGFRAAWAAHQNSQIGTGVS